MGAVSTASRRQLPPPAANPCRATPTPSPRPHHASASSTQGQLTAGDSVEVTVRESEQAEADSVSEGGAFEDNGRGVLVRRMGHRMVAEGRPGSATGAGTMLTEAGGADGMADGDADGALAR